MAFYPFAAAPALTLQNSTQLAGFTLQNATPNIISWSVPNDGQVHRFAVYGQVRVTSAETGGAIQVAYTYPDGSAVTDSLDAGGHAATHQTFSVRLIMCAPGTAVTVQQSSALSAGAAVAWAEIWGS